MPKVWTIKIEFLDGNVKEFRLDNLQNMFRASSRAPEDPVFFKVHNKDGSIHFFPLVSIREVTFE